MSPAFRAHLCERCWSWNEPQRPPGRVLVPDSDPCSCCGEPAPGGASIYRRMTADELEQWAHRVKSTAPLRGDLKRDPFVDGAVPAKSVFRIVSQRTGQIVRYYAKPHPESHAFECETPPLGVLRGEPCDILAPSGWQIVGILLEPDALGSRWAIPFSEVPR